MSLRLLALLTTLALPVAAWAQTTQSAKPEVAIKVITEDQQKLIQATVTLNGKPLNGAAVAFFVQRTFGRLTIGHDTTLDDGTAAVPFPTGLPGGPTGQLQVTAQVTAPPQYSQGSAATVLLDGGQIVPAQPTAFPRALWAPRAPVLLVLTIAAILASVWGCYVYVVAQLVAISRSR